MKAQSMAVIGEAAQAFWKELPLELRLSGKTLAYFPILAKGVSAGLMLPDIDIIAPGIGIGGHRWAVTHSALAAYLTREGMNVIARYVEDGATRSVLKQALTAGGVGFCLGVSIHLLKDTFWDNEQSVRFVLPFIGGKGTLVEGTYLDDDTWLGTNGLIVLKFSYDTLLLGFGEDIDKIRDAFHTSISEREARERIQSVREDAQREAVVLRKSLSESIPTDESRIPEFPDWINMP